MDFSNAEQTNVKFTFTTPENSIYTMLYEPLSTARVKAAFGVCILDGYESDWTSDSDFTSDYILYDGETGDVYANVSVQTAPADAKAYFGVTTDEELVHEMQPSFFPTQSFHDGMRKNIVEDFGYELVVDWTGTAFGARTCYLEFNNPDTGMRSMRFYLCNDNMSEYFYSLSIRADVPMEDEQKINDLREMIFSLHLMDMVTDSNIQSEFKLG